MCVVCRVGGGGEGDVLFVFLIVCYTDIFLFYYLVLIVNFFSVYYGLGIVINMYLF